MSLNPVARYLVPGAVAGAAAFAFSRVMIAPLVERAVDYEAAREHVAEHGHAHGMELFTRAVQENLGAATGVIGFSIVMGVLFAVVYQLLQTVLERGGHRPDPGALAVLTAAGMCVAVSLVPALKYPANPPGVGLDETTAQRSSAFLTLLAVSVAAAVVAVVAGVTWAGRWGAWRAAGVAVGGYLAVTVCTMALLPGFREVPGPVVDADGTLLLDGFPARVLADFRVYSLLNQAIMWAVIGIVAAALLSRPRLRLDDLVGAR